MDLKTHDNLKSPKLVFQQLPDEVVLRLNHGKPIEAESSPKRMAKRVGSGLVQGGAKQ